MSRRSRHREADESEVNMTPMLDVVFIMLIFFIVTASFTKESGLDTNRPDTAPQTKSEKATILVEISESNRITINRLEVDIRAVRPNIERLHAEKPQAPVAIRAHRGSDNGVLVDVMDASREAGVNPSIAE